MNIIICGFGRAGQALAKVILQRQEDTLIGVITHDASNKIGEDIGTILGMGEQGITIKALSKADDDFTSQDVDVIIDFSNHAMALPLIHLAGRLGSRLVICTTNHSYSEVSEFEMLAGTYGIGIVYAPNLTIGINLLIEFVEKLSRSLPEFDFRIVEKHRKDKAPVTNTARIIAQAIDREDTPIYSIRAGGYVGIHEVSAVGECERITVEHESFSREAFANGALLAARFLQDKTGYYEMRDVVRDIYNSKL